MSLIGLIVVLLFIGVALYLVSLVPMDARIKQIIYVLVILFIVIWLLQVLGLLTGLGDIRIK